MPWTSDSGGQQTATGFATVERKLGVAPVYTTNEYDALGWITTVTQPDSSIDRIQQAGDSTRDTGFVRARRAGECDILGGAESYHSALLGLQAARTNEPLDLLSAAELGACADDLAFLHGVKSDNNNHAPAVFHSLTGNQFPGSASL